MKKQNQINKPIPQEDESEVNWIVVGPIIAIMLGLIIWVFIM
jgi:hypothetical protein